MFTECLNAMPFCMLSTRNVILKHSTVSFGSANSDITDAVSSLSCIANVLAYVFKLVIC